MWAFGFQPICHESVIFSFEFIKVCLRRPRRLRHDLSTPVESNNQRDLKSRVYVYVRRLSRTGKGLKCPGYAQGGC